MPRPSPKTTQGPGRPRDPEIDRLLTAAALRELSEYGYSAMSIDRIAQETGIGKPSIYRRFAGKAELTIAALEQVTMSEGPEATGDLVEDLARQILFANGNLEKNGSVPLLGTLLAERDRQPELIELYRERLFEPRRRKIVALLRHAQEKGDVREGAEVESASLLMLGFVAASYVAGRDVTPSSIRKAVAAIVDGLREPKPLQSASGKPASLRAQTSAGARRRPTDR
ncbi:MAG TPA: TetR/AcrR family transcriptional regulator [Verrucomicrobiae bacterium]|nr:TetR/AcrR family transcriptional regulator [Verrucomicrobiae bacterium]